MMLISIRWGILCGPQNQPGNKLKREQIKFPFFMKKFRNRIETYSYCCAGVVMVLLV